MKFLLLIFLLPFILCNEKEDLNLAFKFLEQFLDHAKRNDSSIFAPGFTGMVWKADGEFHSNLTQERLMEVYRDVQTDEGRFKKGIIFQKESTRAKIDGMVGKPILVIHNSMELGTMAWRVRVKKDKFQLKQLTMILKK